MFYEPKNGHGLKHNPFGAIIAPRPIAWVSTRGQNGQDNLAPYSFFNAVAYSPPQIMFASIGHKPDRIEGKDSLAHIQANKVFAINIVAYAAKDTMNASSASLPANIDEFDAAGVPKTECKTINCPRVADAPASLECELTHILPLMGAANFAIFGEVTGVHLRPDCLTDGRFDITKFQPLARLGYKDYATISEVFSLDRPG